MINKVKAFRSFLISNVKKRFASLMVVTMIAMIWTAFIPFATVLMYYLGIVILMDAFILMLEGMFESDHMFVLSGAFVFVSMLTVMNNYHDIVLWSVSDMREILDGTWVFFIKFPKHRIFGI